MRADLHIHTNFSYDGLSSPDQVIQKALEEGIDCVCITDHQEIEGAREALRFASDKNILVIPGIEVTSRSGDIVGINIKKRIPANLSSQETIKEIRRQGGIAVIPHPFDIPPFGFKESREALKRMDFDALEVFNAGRILKSCNKKAWELALSEDLPFTAGSDAHRAYYVGRGYLEFEQEFRSAEELIRLIKEKKGVARGRSLNLAEVFWNSTRARIF